MFGQMTIPFRDNIHSYGDALKYWSECKPWRGETGEHDERPLKQRRYRNTGVTKKPDGRVVFRLHTTEVLTYEPSGEIVLKVYSSVTTGQFVRAYSSLSVSLSAFGTLSLSDPERRVYKLSHGDRVRISADRQSATGSSPWRIGRVDRKRANAMRRETGLSQFWQFVRAAAAMAPPDSPELERRIATWVNDRRDVRELLQDRSAWPCMLHARAVQAVNMFEQDMIRRHCVDHTTREWVSIHELRSAIEAERRY